MSVYTFVDITEASPTPALPSEAVWFDGICLDLEVSSFRTLGVQGREIAEKEIDTYDTGNDAGEAFRRAYYKTRTITVTYQIKAASSEQFRESYNQLNRCLQAEQARLIFNDEPDKYFIATKASNNEVDAGQNSVIGNIEFLCSDPRKYSVVEKVFKASLVSGILKTRIYNSGSLPVPINYKITHSHDNGYIGIISEHGAIQLGKMQEADGETYQQNENLLGIQAIVSAQDDHGTNYMHPNHDMGGTLGVLSGENYQHMVIGSMGTGQSGKWCGGMRTVSIPADSAGVIGAQNFWCYINWWFESGLMGQTAEQSIAFLTADNKVICGYSLYKTDMSGNTAALDFWLNGKVVATKNFTPSSKDSDNPFSYGRGHQDVRKEGDKITFYWSGSYIPYVDSAVKDMICTKIQVAFTQYFGRNLGDQYVTRNYLRVLSFQKMNVEKWRDVPNRYSSGDVVTIDGGTTKVYRNGMNITGDEITGSKYFLAPPGVTDVEFHCSDFCDPPPAVDVFIREAYL